MAFTAAACFGVGGIIAKAAFNAGVAPSLLAEWRILFGFLVYAALFAIIRPSAFRVRRADLPLFVLFGVVGLAGVQWSYYESIQRLPVGVAVVIQYTAPVLLLIWARLRGRKVGARLWLAAALALVGCFFAAGAYDAVLFQLNTAGVALSVLSALIFALYFSVAERILKRYDTPTLLVYGFGFALIAWASFRPIWTLPWTKAHPRGAGRPHRHDRAGRRGDRRVPCSRRTAGVPTDRRRRDRPRGDPHRTEPSPDGGERLA